MTATDLRPQTAPPRAARVATWTVLRPQRLRRRHVGRPHPQHRARHRITHSTLGLLLLVLGGAAFTRHAGRRPARRPPRPTPPRPGRRRTARHRAGRSRPRAQLVDPRPRSDPDRLRQRLDRRRHERAGRRGRTRLPAPDHGRVPCDVVDRRCHRRADRSRHTASRRTDRGHARPVRRGLHRHRPWPREPFLLEATHRGEHEPEQERRQAARQAGLGTRRTRLRPDARRRVSPTTGPRCTSATSSVRRSVRRPTRTALSRWR